MPAVNTKFVYTANGVFCQNAVEGTIHDAVLPGVYKYCVQDTMSGPVSYLQPVQEGLKIPFPIFGEHQKRRCEKVCHSFEHNDSNIGVLLSGQKGSGKTVLSAMIGNEMVTRGHPVIIVDSLPDDNTLNFLNLIDNSVLIFDEADKFISNDSNGLEANRCMLSLLDGVGKAKHLSVMTVNEPYFTKKYMANRPSRIRYQWEYGAISDETLAEIIDYYGLDDRRAELEDSIKKYSTITVDILISIIDEIKTFPDSSIADIIADMYLTVGDESMQSMMMTIKDASGVAIWTGDAGYCHRYTDIDVYLNSYELANGMLPGFPIKYFENLGIDCVRFDAKNIKKVERGHIYGTFRALVDVSGDDEEDDDERSARVGLVRIPKALPADSRIDDDGTIEFSFDIWENKNKYPWL